MRERWKCVDEGGSIGEVSEESVGCKNGLNRLGAEGIGVFPQGVDKTEPGYGGVRFILV